MDTGRVIRAMFGISNSKNAKYQFKNRVMVRYGKAYAVNSVCVLSIRDSFFDYHGSDCWEEINENDGVYTFEQALELSGFDADNTEPWINTKFDTFIDKAERDSAVNEYGLVKVDPVEVAKVLRVFSAKTQARNKRKNHLVEYKGNVYTIMDLSELTGIKYSTLQSRIRRGLSDEELLTDADEIRELLGSDAE